jgi:DNA helicase-2/ATP-dependent DNA helicase PcrA
LEFPVVATIGLEEGCLPHSRAQEDPEDLEEERRLCFVGITRAQERLILGKAAYRTIRGLRERTATSQFLAQMPQAMLNIIDRVGNSTFSHDRDMDMHPDPDSQLESAGDQFRIGQRVRHPSLGMGRIVDLPNSASGARAVVQFDRAGLKTLILEHARLSPA